MFGLGIEELLVILLIVILIVGVKRLPQLSKDIGKSGRELRDGFTGGKNDKSLKDIAKEVGSSAKEIKKGRRRDKKYPPLGTTYLDCSS